jgi:hypothetical protein
MNKYSLFLEDTTSFESRRISARIRVEQDDLTHQKMRLRFGV